jgi:hypothetical protein
MIVVDNLRIRTKDIQKVKAWIIDHMPGQVDFYLISDGSVTYLLENNAMTDKVEKLRLVFATAEDESLFFLVWTPTVWKVNYEAV